MMGKMRSVLKVSSSLEEWTVESHHQQWTPDINSKTAVVTVIDSIMSRRCQQLNNVAAEHDGQVRRQQRSMTMVDGCVIMLRAGEVDDEVLSKKLKSAVVVAGQDFVIVGAGNIDLTSHSDSEVNTMHLLHSDYIVLRRTYDLSSSSSEGHMGQCDSSDIEFMLPQCMKVVIVITTDNDDNYLC